MSPKSIKEMIWEYDEPPDRKIEPRPYILRKKVAIPAPMPPEDPIVHAEELWEREREDRAMHGGRAKWER